MKARWMFIIGLILALFVAINGYIGWHIWLFLSYTTGTPNSAAYWACLWLVAFSYFIARIGSKYMPELLARILKWTGSYWMVVIMYGVILLPLADAAALLLHAASVPAAVSFPILGLICAGILAIIFIRGSYNAWSPVVRTYDIHLPKQAGDWRQLRIAVASDLHLGTIVGRGHLRRLVERVNALRPDLILLPGDVIDDELEPFLRFDMGSIMRGLTAPLGTYAVLGNHEYIGGHIPAFVEEMKRIGIRVLMDETVHIANRLYVAGRKDKAAGAGGRKPLAELLADVDLSQPVIVMDHQPHRLDQAAEAGADVMLSGHTHRGQMMPNHWITRRLFELDWGYLVKGRLHAIVSSGYGTWGPPVRIGSRSEIIELVLHFDGQEK